MAFQFGQDFIAMIDQRLGHRAGTVSVWLMLVLLMLSVLAVAGLAWTATIQPLFTFFSGILSGVVQGSGVVAAVLTGVAAFAGYWVAYRLFLKKAFGVVVEDYQRVADHLGDLVRFTERVDQNLSRLSPLPEKVEDLNERLSQVERLYASLQAPTVHQLPVPPAPNVDDSTIGQA